MTRRSKLLPALLLSAALVAAGCGSDSDSAEADSTSTTAAGSSDTGADNGAPDGCDPLPTKEDGKLIVATGEPAFEPWVVDDDPESGEGFEAAVVDAVAAQLGVTEVEWVRTGFDAAVAPGAKDYDFNLQQYSITDERDEVVDFSRGYYAVEQAVIAPDSSPIAGATSIADLKEARLGAAIGTTSLDFAEEVIDPSAEVQVFDDNAAAKAAFDAGRLDGLVLDLPTAYYVTAVEIEGTSIVGVLPSEGDDHELGFLLEEGSPLKACLDIALDELDDDGTLDELADTWLQGDGEIPTLTE